MKTEDEIRDVVESIHRILGNSSPSKEVVESLSMMMDCLNWTLGNPVPPKCLEVIEEIKRKFKS